MGNQQKPMVECKMMVRKPVQKVFEAFTDPSITIHFWFTKSSGKLEEGKTVTWTWEMYGQSTKVMIKEILPNEKIAIDWGDPKTSVDFEFEAIGKDKTYITIKHYGFNVKGDKLIESIKDNTGGFTTVLDGLKAYLEHGIDLNLIADKYPQKSK